MGLGVGGARAHLFQSHTELPAPVLAGLAVPHHQVLNRCSCCNLMVRVQIVLLNTAAWIKSMLAGTAVLPYHLLSWIAQPCRQGSPRLWPYRTWAAGGLQKWAHHEAVLPTATPKHLPAALEWSKNPHDWPMQAPSPAGCSQRACGVRGNCNCSAVSDVWAPVRGAGRIRARHEINLFSSVWHCLGCGQFVRVADVWKCIT